MIFFIGDYEILHLNVKFEIHFYCGDQLNDGYIFLRNQGYGLCSPDFFLHILKFNNKTIEIDIDDYLDLGGFRDLIYKTIWETFTGVNDGSTFFYFVASGIRYSIDNPSQSLSYVLNKYIDPENAGVVNVALYVCEEAGSFDSDGKLRYYFHSHEKGKHNEPHVHVSDIGHNFEEPISILSGRVLSDNPRMPTKYQEQAKQYILDNQRKFLEGWNIKTDGLIIDINQVLGLSSL